MSRTEPRNDAPKILGCDPSCTAEGGYPALCEMYPDEKHEGCPRQRAASSSESVPSEAPKMPPIVTDDAMPLGWMMLYNEGTRSFAGTGPNGEDFAGFADSQAEAVSMLRKQAERLRERAAAPVASVPEPTPHFVCGPTCGCGNLTPFVRVGAYWRSPDACAHCGKKFGQPTLFGAGEKNG